MAAQANAADSGKLRVVEAETVSPTSAELSAELGKKWGAVLTQGYGVSEQGLKMFVDGYANYPADVLKSALNAKNFEAMNSALMDHNQMLANALAEKIRNEADSMSPVAHKVKADLRKALGDEARDLVYIPIASCRTFDTRFASALGPTFNGAVTPGNPKNAFVFWSGSPSSWTAYGGTVDSCPDTTTVAGPLANTAPYAVALNLGIVGPVGTGWVTVYRSDLADPSASVVSQLVQSGVNDTALVISNVCRGATGVSCVADIKIASRGTNVDVAGDIVGYFIKPQATALQCNEVYATTNVTVAAGATACTSGAAQEPVCAAGFTATAAVPRWISGATGAALTQVQADPSGGFHSACWTNSSGGSAAMQAGVRCCRVPGR